MHGLSKAVITVAALLIAVPLAIIYAGSYPSWTANLLQFVAAALAAAACLRAAKRSPQGRLPWLLLGASSAAWAIGQGIWTVQEELQGADVPFPGPADAGFLLASLLAVPAILLFMRTPGARRDLGILLLDGLGASLLMMVAGWVLLLREPTLAEPDWLKATIGAAYPALDVVILGALLSAFPRLAKDAKRRLWMLVAGMSCITVADLSFNYATLTGSYETGAWIDFGWVAGFALIAVFAMRAAGTTNPLRMGTPTGLETALPFAPVPIAGAAIAYDQVRGIAPDAVLVWTALAWLATVSTRQFLLVRSQQALLTQVQESFHMEREAALSRERVTELERLHAQERFRTDFINKTAHELATPMTPIRLHLRLLGGDQTAEGRERSLDSLTRNVDRLGNLVNDLVDAARIDAAQLVLERRNVDLRTLLDLAVQQLRPKMLARDQDVVLDLHGQNWVYADPVRIEQAFTNLILGAAEASPTGKVIRVRAEAAGGEVQISIEHEGDLDPLALQPFGAPGLANGGGSAVGLHVARGLLRLHGTELVHEVAPGGGHFLVRLPMAP